MSTQSGYAFLQPASIGSGVTRAPLYRAWQHAMARLRGRFRRRRQLQHLVDLDDRLLADVGLTREQALSAAKEAYYWI